MKNSFIVAIRQKFAGAGGLFAYWLVEYFLLNRKD